MATTINYSWVTPDDTSLVKDGAAAIRSLGTSIDTTTKALNPSTTLGDIEYRSSTANTNTSLGIGTTGQILTVSGGVPSWAAPAASGGMTLISTTTLSGTSTTLSSIPGTYKALILYFRDMYCSTADSFRIRFNSDATSNAYAYTGSYFEGNTSYTDFGAMGVLDTSVMLQQQSTPTAAANDNAATIKLYDYANTAAFKFFESDSYMTTASRKQIESKRGFWKNTSAISSILITNAGGYTQNGTVLLYGVA